MIDERVVEAGVALWVNAHRHARCRYKYQDRPSDKGRSQPLENTVDELLERHAPWSTARGLYLRYETAIRLRAKEWV